MDYSKLVNFFRREQAQPMPQVPTELTPEIEARLFAEYEAQQAMKGQMMQPPQGFAGNAPVEGDQAFDMLKRRQMMQRMAGYE